MVELSDQTTTSPSFRATPYCPSSIRSVLMFVNSLIPRAPSSLPCPEHFTTPNGIRGSDANMRLMNSIPEASWLTNFSRSACGCSRHWRPGRRLGNPFRKTRPAKQFFNQRALCGTRIAAPARTGNSTALPPAPTRVAGNGCSSALRPPPPPHAPENAPRFPHNRQTRAHFATSSTAERNACLCPVGGLTIAIATTFFRVV